MKSNVPRCFTKLRNPLRPANVHHFSNPKSWMTSYVMQTVLTRFNRKLLFEQRTITLFRSSPSEVYLRKGVLKICSKFEGEHPCRSAISIKLQCNFIEIALRHGCSPSNLLQIFRAAFHKNTTGWLHLFVPK